MHRLLVAILLSLPLAVESAGTAPVTVQLQVRNVALHVDEAAVLMVHRLRGELVSTRRHQPPIFDDKHSFVVRIDSGEISLTPASLSRLLNDYVFNYEGSPLSGLEVGIEGGQLTVKGTLHKGIAVPITIAATPQVDRGDLRLRPTSIKALGIPVKEVMSLFRLELGRLVKVAPSRGVRLEGDDFLIAPSALVPPPRIEGRLAAVRLERDRIVQVFGPGTKAPLTPPDRTASNYMYYRGGVLRFGKLTMTDADMQLIDQDASDVFDFYQDRYDQQLVAGYSKNTPELGLKVYMPDYHRLTKPAAPRAAAGDPAGSARTPPARPRVRPPNARSSR